ADPGYPGGIPYSGTDAATIIQNAIDALPTTGGTISLNAGIYNITTTILINKPVLLSGDGPGLLWNAYELSETELKWAGVSNNIPMIKIVGTTTISGEKDSWTIIRDLKLYYSGTATGTDGIYLDGENGLVRHVFLDDINVLKFL